MEERNQIAARARYALELVAQEIFDGLDVVIRLLLECLDALRVVRAELVDDPIQERP